MGNEVDTQHKQSKAPIALKQPNDPDPQVSQMCQDLIELGFAEDIAREVAPMYPHNLNHAVDWILNKETIDKIINGEEDVNNDGYNAESDNKQMQFNDEDNDGYNAENEEEFEDNQKNDIGMNHNYDIDNESINNEDALQVRNSNSNSNNISEALETADIVIKGEYNPDVTPESMLIMTDLMNAALSNNLNSNPMMKHFTEWSNNVKNIKLNSFYYQDICKYLLADHKRVKNLYAFDKINEVFKNVEVIESYHTGWVSLYYFEALLQVLDKVRYMEYSKLHKICLNDINNMGSILSTDFEEYQSLFQQKNWNIEKDVSNLIVTRYYY